MHLRGNGIVCSLDRYVGCSLDCCVAWCAAVNRHAVVIAGAGPTGMMLGGELALAGVDVAIVERRTTTHLDGSRAGGLHPRT
ncbi:MAG TPA: FAD-dependent monooxygenase, partial [Acidimicrobiales bacterium]|nr:FAD-dependent monooxygenase [Acidimicrobiales bacterium]